VNPNDAGEKFKTEAEPIKETDKALLVNVEGEEFWLPKQFIDDDSEVYSMKSGSGMLVIPLWLAKEKGLA
jgi:hypothetical protein